jgi:hypothetical protein
MPLNIGWGEIALRLALTVAAGILIGLNRSEHGHAAGLRTTLLVCLAASLSMLQVNLLLSMIGKTPSSFAVMDLMRLPLGQRELRTEVCWRARPHETHSPAFLQEVVAHPGVLRLEWKP